MKNFLSIYKNSPLVKWIVNKILIIQLISMSVVLLISIVILNPLLRQQAINTAIDVNTYMASVLDSAFESITLVSKHIVSSDELSDSIQSYNEHPTAQAFQKIRLVLSKLISTHAYVRGVILDSPDGNCFTSISGVNAEDLSALKKSWYINISKQNYGQSFSMLTENSNNMGTFWFSKNSFIDSKKYTITILYNANPILDSVCQYSENMFSGFLLLDFNNNVLFQSGEIDVPANRLFLPSIQNNFQASNGLYFSHSIQTSMWKVVSFAKNSTISLVYRNYLITTILMFFISSILVVLLLTPSIYKRIKPINALSNATRQVTSDNLTHIPEIKTNDEVGDLSRMINKMIDSLSEFSDKTIKQAKNEQTMKYSLLISQIDPHFIYNTMSIITALAGDQRTKDIVAINNALITILQDRLRVNAVEVFDTVRHEIDIVQKYLLIQNYRYENHAEFLWDVDETLLDYQIPKNVIQPLVENALFHGLINETTGVIEGKIHIRIYINKEHFIIQVRDNGRGFNEEKVLEFMHSSKFSMKNRGRHIGLRNIRECLEYLYGNHGIINIKNDQGTTVTIQIELKKMQKIN